MKCLLLFLNLSVLLSYVASLGIALQPQTIVGSPTLVVWTRDDTDPDSMTFDLRFVQGDADVGLALANIDMGEDDQFGTVSVTFPAQGQYILKAVTGSPRNTVVGVSKQVTAIGLNTPPSSSASVSASTTTLASAATPSSASATNTASSTGTLTPASPPTSKPSQPSSSNTPSMPLARLAQHPNLPAIIGGVLAGLLILALLALLFVMLGRRRKAFNRRLTFHKDMMVQPRLMIQPRPNMLSLPSGTPASVASSPTATSTVHNGQEHGDEHGNEREHDLNHLDVEQGLHSGSIPRPLGSGHVVPPPKGPRPSIKHSKAPAHAAPASAAHARSPTVTMITTRLPVGPAPLRTRRQRQIGDRIRMLQRQIEDVQQQQRDSQAYSGMDEGQAEAEAERRRALEEMHREMVWLRDHEQSPWAMGLTEVLPPGYARYMTP